MFKGHSGERGNNGEDREIVMIQAGIPSFIHHLNHADRSAIPAFERGCNHVARDGAGRPVDFFEMAHVGLRIGHDVRGAGRIDRSCDALISGNGDAWGCGVVADGMMEDQCAGVRVGE